MTEQLTIKQVQDLLQVDRITVYRMLKDGRLSGFKVGKQWRIPRSEIDRLMQGEPITPPPDKMEQLTPEEALPVHCVQVIQDIFANMLNISSVTIDLQGGRVTEFSNTCAFCKLIQQSEAGREACSATWAKIGASTNGNYRTATCHAGLNYTSCRIEQFDQPLAIQIGGQYITSEEERESIREEIPNLANQFNISPENLEAALEEVTLLPQARTAEITTWLEKVASTFEIIAYERSELLGRLNEIASISTFQSKGEFLSQ